MKNFKKLLFAALAFTAINAQAQTADEIVSKNIDAMGGTAKLSTLKTVKMSGSINIQAAGMDFPITITKVHMKGMRLDLDAMGSNNYQILTNDKATMFFPAQGMTEPQSMGEDAIKGAPSQFDLQGSLFNYKEKGKKIELVGTEKAEGADAFHLKVTDANGKVSHMFIDTKTYRLIKSSGTAKGPDGAEVETQTIYTDYKQNADGYWFPYGIAIAVGQMTFDKIETNVTVDEKIFAD